MNHSDTRHERMLERPRLPENLLQRALELNEGLILLNSIQEQPAENNQVLQPEYLAALEAEVAESNSLEAYREAVKQAHQQGVSYDQKAA